VLTAIRVNLVQTVCLACLPYLEPLFDKHRLPVLILIRPFLLQYVARYRSDVGEWVWPLQEFRQQIECSDGVEDILLAATTVAVKQGLALIIDVDAE